MKCPKCGSRPKTTQTRFGKRTSCCDLVGWDGKPMMDQRTRDRRQEFHAVFDPLWKSGRFTRNTAYNLLADKMGIPESEVHGAKMTYDRLGEAIEAVNSINK